MSYQLTSSHNGTNSTIFKHLAIAHPLLRFTAVNLDLTLTNSGLHYPIWDFNYLLRYLYIHIAYC